MVGSSGTGQKTTLGIHSLENVTNPAKTFNVQYSHDGASVPIVAGKMVCFINPLTQLFSPPFWEKYLKSIFSIPSLNAAFPSVYAVANVITILNCNGLIMSRIIGKLVK